MDNLDKIYIDERIGKSGTVVRLVAYSRSVNNPDSKIATFECEYWRAIHSEIMTHRCLAGDTELHFDLPSGVDGNNRIYKITIKDFYKKWKNGSEGLISPNRHRDLDLSLIDENKLYSAKELAKLVDISVTSIRTVCRERRCICQNPNKNHSEDYIILGKDYINYRKAPKNYNFSLNSKLETMNVRMLNTENSNVTHTNITDIWEVGLKDTYTLRTNNSEITATLDHLFLTEDGWKEMGDLKIGDYVICCNGNTSGGEATVDKNAHSKINGQWKQTFNRKVLPELTRKQNGKCAHCGGTHNKLEVHHLKPVYEYPNLSFDTNNVVAVCNDCHRNFYHKKQGWQVSKQKLVPVSEQIISIDFCKKQMVYDLSVASDEHNFIANNFVVHNCLSRNASSSRAVNVDAMREQATDNPAYPITWGLNKSGMQADKYHETPKLCIHEWDRARTEAIYQYDNLKKLGLHKQIVNRVLEPFTKIKTVLTATELDNFFYLRLQEDVEPNMHELAELMYDLLQSNEAEWLSDNQWHTPYVAHDCVNDHFAYVVDGVEVDEETALAISTSCCAQVSYRNINNTVEKATNIYKKLNIGTQKGHHSPTEHQAKPMSQEFLGEWEKGVTHMDRKGNYWSGNFKNWVQHRQTLNFNVCNDYEKAIADMGV